MEKADGLELREMGMDAAYQNEMFQVVKDYLKTRLEYVFQNDKLHPENWEISTWSVKVQRSNIMKYGTESDKNKVGPPSRFNRGRMGKDRQNRAGVRVKRRRIQRQGLTRPRIRRPRRATDTEPPADRNQDLPEVPMTERMRQRDQEISEEQQDVLGEIAELRQVRANQQTGFAHVARDGTAVFVARGATQGYGASSSDPNFLQRLAMELDE